MSSDEIERLDALVAIRRSLRRGDRLYHAEEAFGAIYAVRMGSFKSEMVFEDGRVQVTGFYMSGDILGLDGIDSGHYLTHATALEDSQVCTLDFDRLEQLARALPSLQQQMNRIMSREMVNDRCLLLLLATMSADERLASFLLNLSRRLASRGYSGHEFHLRMTREEIGSYLGLKLETVSRTLSKLQDAGMIEVNNKHILIRDDAALSRLSKLINSKDAR